MMELEDSVCSPTEASVQADSLITPLHHTSLLSYCRFSTDEGFLCVWRKDRDRLHLSCTWTCIYAVFQSVHVTVCLCFHCASQIPPPSFQAWTENITWVLCVCVCVCWGFACVFIYPSAAYLLCHRSPSHTLIGPGLRRRGRPPLSSVYAVRSARSNDH